MVQTLRTTSVAGLTLWHNVPNLGPRVVENIAALIKGYASRVSLKELPPITLSGPGWDTPWQSLVTVEGCRGNSGPGDEELRMGGMMYHCLDIILPDETPKPIELNRPDPSTIEGVIAHEICHLRWPSLRHGPEFHSRVIALLKGAVFPVRGRWRRSTEQIMQLSRREANCWYDQFLTSKREV